MQKRAYIHAMLSYIEDHLSEDLKPESIAGGHFISVSQLYRDFYAFTGHSVKAVSYTHLDVYKRQP